MWIRLLLAFVTLLVVSCHDFDEQHHVELHRENNRLHKEVNKYKNQNHGHNHRPQPQNIQLVRKACTENAYSLSGQLVPGKTMAIHGKPGWNRKTISFNLLDIFAEWPMHMAKIGFDSYRHGKYLRKTAHVPSQFWPNTAFVVEIKIQSYTYELFVNGIKVYNFAHRSPVSELSGFALCGVDVTSVQLR